MFPALRCIVSRLWSTWHPRPPRYRVFNEILLEFNDPSASCHYWCVSLVVVLLQFVYVHIRTITFGTLRLRVTTCVVFRDWVWITVHSNPVACTQQFDRVFFKYEHSLIESYQNYHIRHASSSCHAFRHLYTVLSVYIVLRLGLNYRPSMNVCSCQISKSTPTCCRSVRFTYVSCNVCPVSSPYVSVFLITVISSRVLFFFNTFISLLNAICIVRKCSNARILYSSICIILILCRNYHPSITVCSCQAVRVNTDVSTTYNYSRYVLVTLVSSRVILIQIDVAIKCNLCSSNAFWHLYTVFSVCIVLRLGLNYRFSINVCSCQVFTPTPTCCRSVRFAYVSNNVCPVAYHYVSVFLITVMPSRVYSSFKIRS